MDSIVLIDGGTTNTRFTLMSGNKLLDRIERNVGAASTSNSGHNQALESTVKEVLTQLEAAHDCHITKVFASGMITSNVGLLEIPHYTAPVTLNQLAESMRPHVLSNISPEIQFYFVPGIKTMGNSLEDQDVMRGEETEIFGALNPCDYAKTVLFVHFGSHNKMILYQNNAIVKSVTTVSGELFWAIANHTILKSSVGDLDVPSLSAEFVKKGYREAVKNGTARALFLTRIQQIIDHRTEIENISFLYGILAQSDLSAFRSLLSNHVDKMILYGRNAFLNSFLICMEEFFDFPKEKIILMDYQSSSKLSVLGLQKISGLVLAGENK